MVLHSLAAVLLWLNVVVVAAVVVFVVGVQDRNCWLALLAVGVWFIVNFMPQLPTKRSQMGTTSGMFFCWAWLLFWLISGAHFGNLKKDHFWDLSYCGLKQWSHFLAPKMAPKLGPCFAIILSKFCRKSKQGPISGKRVFGSCLGWLSRLLDAACVGLHRWSLQLCCSSRPKDIAGI